MLNSTRPTFDREHPVLLEKREISLLVSESDLEALDWLVVDSGQTPHELLQAFVKDLTRSLVATCGSSAARTWLIAHRAKDSMPD